MKPSRIIAGLVGAIVGLTAVVMLFGGAALLWAHATQRDADGFYTSPTYALATSGHALVSTDVDLAAHPGDWWPTDLADVRLEASSATGTAVFVGIGPSDAVDRYLADVAISEVTRLGDDATDVTYRTVDGGAPVEPPADQGFWVASSAGTGTQSLTWAIEPGAWTVVVMNADAGPGIEVAMTAGAGTGVLGWVGGIMLALGLVGAAAAAALLVWAIGPPTAVPAGTPSAAMVGRYPVWVEGAIDPGLTRWMWLVKWFLAIPHLVVLALLWVAFGLLSVVAFFSILFTGRYPRAVFEFNVGVLRWNWRVGFYAFSVLGTDQYPPFTLAATDYPATLEVAYPTELSRGLVLVKWWLLAIPQYVIVGFFTSGLIWWTTEFGDGDQMLKIGGGLIGILALIAGVALAFTGRYPHGLFDLLMGLNRWVYRVATYAGLMRDEYPPFRLDLGGSEPAPNTADGQSLGAGAGTSQVPPTDTR